jgi:hypothetical protein
MVPTDRRSDWRRAAWGRIWIAIVLVAVEVALIAVASVAWRSSNADVDTAAISLLGVSAVVGIPILVVIALANVQAARALRSGGPPASPSGLASAGRMLAALRLAAVIVAAVVVLAVEVAGSFDLADTCTAGIAVFDGLLAVLVAIVTVRGIARAV